ncbi:MAG: histidine phosphatase family protein, partial [Ilumatobacter sp.]|nr:histidine phosphatase family protein [Ilumatobacter sp.]
MLYLVRHGRTDANAKGLLQGRLDPPLDDLGRRQAAAIAERIGDVDEIIASPLQRAQETAGYFGSGAVTTDERWLELAYGEYEGVPVGEVPPEIWQSWRTNAEFATKGGESFAELNERVRAACSDLADRLGGRDIVVVSHVSPIKSAVSWALGTTMEIMFNCHLSQASLCRVDIGT